MERDPSARRTSSPYSRGRRYPISRKTGYKRLQRYREIGVVRAGNTNVTVGDKANASLANAFLNCKLASLRIGNDALATGDVDAIVARNTFERNDFSSGFGGDFDFPMSRVKYVTRGADTASFDGFVANNTFTSVARADRDVGQLTLDWDDGDRNVRVNNNTFDRPFDAPWFVRADSSVSAKILFKGNA